ncbi:Sushi, von Willebrand factor type A, EGF and pentraxin [Desmophyllum pertusum]|uniref:Sushi, von Willebrand factor type A, EGF and pentraxin n=1 Tax=Desmophyllum pertusum TaxID=174260 RepID=A0A9X0DCE4_9CNID|nr:Sushi, von Willebrand factor type A, EGF and pentraxin [Desmophyllum pertusum]
MRGSCTHAYNCQFQAWSGWSGSVSQGTCRKQSRYRDYNQQPGSCKYASCSLGGWSSWADLASPVSGQCASQQRTRSYDLSWLYTERLDNCNGVEPLSCPSPQVENREKDIRPPSITCPISISVPTDPGKPTATVSIPKASATDNNGQLPTITNNAGAESKEFIVSSVPHEVIYTATDAAGLSASCTLQITVSDKERPRVSSCPPYIKKQTDKNEIRVTWDYPVFVDNFDRPPVQLRISTVACTYFEAPAYGARACNKKTKDSNGVIYEMICVIQCRDGCSFVEPETPNTYMCQSDGTWYKLVHGAALVPVVPKSHRPWPDCAPEQNPDAAKKNFTFYTGSCTGNDEEALARIRENFLNAVKASPLAKYLLCDVSKGQDCVIEKHQSLLRGEFQKEKRRRTDHHVRFCHPRQKSFIRSQVECSAGSYYNRDSQTCKTCQEGSFQNRTGQLSCDACPAGKWSVGGHAKNFTECIVICEPGEFTMHRESGIINCLMCPIGTYQPKYRAKKCEPCPSGKTTAQKASTSINDCV